MSATWVSSAPWIGAELWTHPSNPVKRTCRRRCMGCDPCWICRFSYPISFSVSALGGSGVASGVGDDDSGWVGCCGLVGGTYVPATPFGSDAVNNGTTTHWTFRTPGVEFSKPCSAVWTFNRAWIQQGEYYYEGAPPPAIGWNPILEPGLYFEDTNAVSRCAGDDSLAWSLSFNDDPGSLIKVRNVYGVIEYLREAQVNIFVGGNSFILPSTRAASPDSTRITVEITELLTGYVRMGSPTFRAAVYSISRVERHEIDLEKPCPRSGTVALDFYSRTLNGVYAFADAPAMYGVENYNYADFSAPPCVIANAPNYSVSVTL